MPNIVILGTAHPAATAHEHARPRGDDLADSPILPQLSEALNAHFNRDEIIDLAFDLGLDHEKWPDKGKPGLIRELILKAGWRTSFKAASDLQRFRNWSGELLMPPSRSLYRSN